MYCGGVIGMWYAYFGGSFPCIGEFNSIVYKGRFDRVGVYVGVCCLF